LGPVVGKIETKPNLNKVNVTTLGLGSQPRQGLARLA